MNRVGRCLLGSGEVVHELNFGSGRRRWAEGQRSNVTCRSRWIV